MINPGDFAICGGGVHRKLEASRSANFGGVTQIFIHLWKALSLHFMLMFQSLCDPRRMINPGDFAICSGGVHSKLETSRSANFGGVTQIFLHLWKALSLHFMLMFQSLCDPRRMIHPGDFAVCGGGVHRKLETSRSANFGGVTQIFLHLWKALSLRCMRMFQSLCDPRRMIHSGDFAVCGGGVHRKLEASRSANFGGVTQIFIHLRKALSLH